MQRPIAAGGYRVWGRRRESRLVMRVGNVHRGGAVCVDGRMLRGRAPVTAVRAHGVTFLGGAPTASVW